MPMEIKREPRHRCSQVPADGVPNLPMESGSVAEQHWGPAGSATWQHVHGNGHVGIHPSAGTGPNVRTSGISSNTKLGTTLTTMPKTSTEVWPIAATAGPTRAMPNGRVAKLASQSSEETRAIRSGGIAPCNATSQNKPTGAKATPPARYATISSGHHGAHNSATGIAVYSSIQVSDIVPRRTGRSRAAASVPTRAPAASAALDQP